MKQLTPEEAQSRAEALCSRSEHSAAEMERKLRQWGVSASEAERIVDHLIDERYVDNERFARAFALDKMRYSAWGRIKIAAALRQHGVTQTEAARAFEAFDEEEYLAQLRLVVQRKLRQLRDEEDDYTRRGKLMRHALSHGFEMDLVMREVE